MKNKRYRYDAERIGPPRKPTSGYEGSDHYWAKVLVEENMSNGKLDKDARAKVIKEIRSGLLLYHDDAKKLLRDVWSEFKNNSALGAAR